MWSQPKIKNIPHVNVKCERRVGEARTKQKRGEKNYQLNARKDRKRNALSLRRSQGNNDVMRQKQLVHDVTGACRRHSLRVCMCVLVRVSSMTARRFKYSTWATVPADINNAIATDSHLLHISTLLALEAAGLGNRGRGGREKGRPRIHENSAAHTPASAAKS